MEVTNVVNVTTKPRTFLILENIKSIHEGEGHPCDQCDYQATQRSRLKVHTQSIHKGQCYSCDQCDYQATQKS